MQVQLEDYLIMPASLGNISQVSELLVHRAQFLPGDTRGFYDSAADHTPTDIHFHPLVVWRQLARHQICRWQNVLCRNLNVNVFLGKPDIELVSFFVWFKESKKRFWQSVSSSRLC